VSSLLGHSKLNNKRYLLAFSVHRSVLVVS